jgi:hypothetical protein
MCLHKRMEFEKLSDRHVATLGFLFGAWVFGWPLMADWLVRSGSLDRALGLEGLAFPAPSLIQLLARGSAWRFTTPAPWITGPAATLIASSTSALLAWGFWRLARLIRLDAHALAARSVVWTARATISASFLSLMAFFGLVIFTIATLKDLTDWSLMTFAPVIFAILVVGIPLQICRQQVVQEQAMGPWWTFRRPSTPVLLVVFLLIGVNWGLMALLPTTPFFTVFNWGIAMIFNACIATLLLRRMLSWPQAMRTIGHVTHWSSLQSWLVQQALIMCLLLAVAAPIFAIGYVNVFALPATLEAMDRAGLSKPEWLLLFMRFTGFFTHYWYLILSIVFASLLVWQALMSGRLAFLQTQHSSASSGKNT